MMMIDRKHNCNMRLADLCAHSDAALSGAAIAVGSECYDGAHNTGAFVPESGAIMLSHSHYIVLRCTRNLFCLKLNLPYRRHNRSFPTTAKRSLFTGQKLIAEGVTS